MRPLLRSLLAFPPGPRFELEYERKEDGSLAIAFSIATPGKAYHPHLSGTAQRK
jgi:hypothetical protein